jgi:hypothetical protein
MFISILLYILGVYPGIIQIFLIYKNTSIQSVVYTLKILNSVNQWWEGSRSDSLPSPLGYATGTCIYVFVYTVDSIVNSAIR